MFFDNKLNCDSIIIYLEVFTMHISSLSIRNYRNFRSANFEFQKGINTVIGENGSGKTNLFQALRILIDDSLPRYVSFYQNDFNRSIENWAGHWIIITIFFDELDPSEEAQAISVHANGQMDKKNKGSYSVFFRPKYKFRKELFDYSQESTKTKEGLEIYLDTLSLEDYETVYLCRGSGDFSDDEVYKKYVGDFDNIVFPDPDEADQQVYGTWLPREINIHNEVSCTFIKALRDVEVELRSYSNNPLIRLLRGKEKSIEVKKQGEIIESIGNLNDQIGSLSEVKDVKEGIYKSIKEAVGTTYAPNIDIKSELPDDIDKLFQSLKLWAGDPDDEGYKGKLWELSLGGTNLIYLSLKLLEYEQLRTDRIANFLLIEEPEAHIHTHIQKTLFENLSSNRTQVIISTHSTHISSASKISSVNILTRSNNEADVFSPSKNLKADETIRIERYLDAVRSNLLFAKGVILVEGDAEQILVPAMFKSVFGLSLDEVGVSLINIGSTGFENIATIFHNDRIKKKCAILTDLDSSFIDLPEDPEQDNKTERHFRRSEKSGKERKEKLTEFCKNNDFIETYFSEHTFEVDFLMNGNSYEYVQCLEEIYITDGKRKEAKEKLENDSIQIAGLEVIKLGKKQGKGWLALLVSENLVYNTFIPNHILEAIAFASSHIKPASKVKAINYRLEQIKKNQEAPLFEQARDFQFDNKSESEIIDAYIKELAKDQLTTFLNLL